MKDYFSRIAKHSGLRFSEPVGGAHDGEGKHASHLPAPLGIEETVLVQPTGADERVWDSPERKLEGQTQTAEQRMPKVRARQKQVPAIREDVPARWAEQSDLEHAREEVRMDSPTPGKLEKITPATREEKAPAESKPAGEIRIVEQTVFADAGMPEAHAQADPAQAEEPKAKTVEAEPFEKADKKRYFTKTAEVIERGGLGAAEIQNILFHEVQEWTAASPAGTDIRDINVEETSENVVKQKIVRAVPESGVVAIRGERRVERAESAENSGLEEQSFNLSIGTISVVIEDAEKPVQQAERRRQDQGNQNTRQGSARQFSRLSRNYL